MKRPDAIKAKLLAATRYGRLAHWQFDQMAKTACGRRVWNYLLTEPRTICRRCEQSARGREVLPKNGAEAQAAQT